MTVAAARKWLVFSSFLACGAAFGFFLLAPITGYPLEWSQALRILEVIIPVFLGYLGSAAHYIFATTDGRNNIVRPNPLLGLIVKGPVTLFAGASLAIVVAFGFSNRATAPAGAGMSVDELVGAFTAALGILAVTTNVAVSHLFSIDKPGDTNQDNQAQE